jgi:hypothetical protein
MFICISGERKTPKALVLNSTTAQYTLALTVPLVRSVPADSEGANNIVGHSADTTTSINSWWPQPV